LTDRARELLRFGGRRPLVRLRSGDARTAVVFVAAAVVLALLPRFTSDYTVLVLFKIFEYAALAQAWNLLAGYGGLVSLGSAAFIGIGAYTTGKLTISTGIPLIPAMLIGGAVAAVFAALVSPALFRLRGLYFVIGTLALAQALQLWMVNWNGLGGASGMFLTVAAPTNHEVYYMSLVVMAGATILLWGVLRTRLGISLRALRDNEDAARQMGLWTFRTKLWVFVISSAVMGIVGGLQAARVSAIEPYGSFSIQWTIDTVNIAIIGGMGTVVGPLLGSAFIISLGEKLADHPETHLAITGALMILVIRFAPYGIWGAVLRLLDWTHRRLRRAEA
jgi:branched-chain amino acid transport system permease protein